ncbi:hypothetical protein [Microbacterium sp. 1.5R]|uniref:hypothetical protein n=1 Tax=Microbacterium sp. 1.5R TaxID=1916917 RepID=UPI0011A15C80|nr:hypothetical protein [Microbacterium sp. 1.5R]
MRRLAVIVGGLLLVGGAVIIVVADQQRVDALAEVQAAVVHAEDDLETARSANYALAEQLTALRTQIAAQDAQLADSTGFLP